MMVDSAVASYASAFHQLSSDMLDLKNTPEGIFAADRTIIVGPTFVLLPGVHCIYSSRDLLKYLRSWLAQHL